MSLALAKRAGANAVVVSQAIVDRVAGLQGRLIPPDVAGRGDARLRRRPRTTRRTSCCSTSALATVSIVVLIALAIGWREAIVTLVVIPTTILLTLFAAQLMGYTINRVSLFALIFAIGILVDDAIVVVENIARHWAMRDGRPRMQAAIEAVAEVGNPDHRRHADRDRGAAADAVRVRADGAVHGADPGERLGGDAVLVLRRHGGGAVADAEAGAGRRGDRPAARITTRAARPAVSPRRRAVLRVARPRLDFPAGGRRRHHRRLRAVLHRSGHGEAAAVRQQVGAAGGAEPARRQQPGGHRTHAVRRRRHRARAAGGPSVQAYAGTAAPFNFNGLVRHYYMRQSPELGDLQINLADEGGDAKRSSHAIALDLRQRLQALPLPEGSTLQVVEVPPGPPVLATLLAEIYGPDAATRRAVAEEVKALFRSVPFIVDVGDSYGHPRPRLRVAIDQDELEYLRGRAIAMSTTRCRRCSAASASAIRIAARSAIRSRSASACRSAT